MNDWLFLAFHTVVICLCAIFCSFIIKDYKDNKKRRKKELDLYPQLMNTIKKSPETVGLKYSKVKVYREDDPNYLQGLAELFESTILQSFLQSMKDAMWEDAFKNADNKENLTSRAVGFIEAVDMIRLHLCDMACAYHRLKTGNTELEELERQEEQDYNA